MRISGLQKLAMVDFPGKLAATVFTGGCNLRCPFCHNALLVNRLDQNPENHSVEEVLAFLKSRRGLLDGVVLSGGEPLLQIGAADFLAAVKVMGFAVKLDTNGCYPEKLKEILDRGLVDYVAMDIKNSLARYGETVGVASFDTSPIEASAAYLMEGRVPFEFRTTLVAGLHTAADMEAIGAWLRGEEAFFLQGFVDSGDLIGEGLGALPASETASLLAVLRRYVPNAQIRG